MLSRSSSSLWRSHGHQLSLENGNIWGTRYFVGDSKFLLHEHHIRSPQKSASDRRGTPLAKHSLKSRSKSRLEVRLKLRKLSPGSMGCFNSKNSSAARRVRDEPRQQRPPGPAVERSNDSSTSTRFMMDVNPQFRSGPPSASSTPRSGTPRTCARPSMSSSHEPRTPRSEESPDTRSRPSIPWSEVRTSVQSQLRTSSGTRTPGSSSSRSTLSSTGTLDPFSTPDHCSPSIGISPPSSVAPPSTIRTSPTAARTAYSSSTPFSTTSTSAMTRTTGPASQWPSEKPIELPLPRLDLPFPAMRPPNLDAQSQSTHLVYRDESGSWPSLQVDTRNLRPIRTTTDSSPRKPVTSAPASQSPSGTQSSDSRRRGGRGSAGGASGSTRSSARSDYSGERRGETFESRVDLNIGF